MNDPFDLKRYAAVARQAVAEGIVLLKNDRNALPLREGARIAIFGRSQFHYYKSGTGSGGSVNTGEITGIYEALQQSCLYEIDAEVRDAYGRWLQDHPFDEGGGWASEPWFQEEMPLDAALAEKAAEASEAAVVIIGRTAGEDQDNANAPGSFLLTEAEQNMLRTVCAAFSKTVVLLNTGNIIDMRWVAEFDPAAVLYVWQGGQEGGHGVLDVLSGAVDPCGCLPDTIAREYACYPSAESFGSLTENIQTEDLYIGYRYFETFAREAVLYPFGFGLSYTTFEETIQSFAFDASEGISLSVSVRNTGNVPGKQVVQVYGSAPQGVLGKPARVLLAFAKTELLAPGGEQVLPFHIALSRLASYDDGGLTGHRSAFVLEAGAYRVFAGRDVRSAPEAGAFTLPELVVAEQCAEAMAPVKAFERLRPVEENGVLVPGRESVPRQTVSPQAKRAAALPACLPFTGDRGLRLRDAAEGRVTMEEFLAQLSDADLCALMRGEGMCSPKVTPGIAGAFGAVTDRLRAFGIPIAGCADGPSGIRMDCGTIAFSLPNGTCLASTFNTALNEELFAWEGLEMRRNRIDALLGPGMNLHRNPLNGRNFEYFSEDPLLTGMMACAQLRGLARWGVTGVIKHFCANTQEKLRHHVNAVVSERALREVYLKGFEIAVREGGARAVMSTYGPVNGVWTSGNYDLLTAILRGEWGFSGIVMTDWWAMANDAAGEAGSYANVSAQVRAQNDLNMVNTDAAANSNGDDLEPALASGRLTRGELVRSAANICRFLLTVPAWKHSLGEESPLDEALRAGLSEEDTAMRSGIPVEVDEKGTVLDAALIRTGRGETTVLSVGTPRRGRVLLELEVRAVAESPMAQLPFSVFRNRELVRSVTLTGADSTWQEFSFELLEPFNYFYAVKLYFSRRGLELRNIRLRLTENLEEELRAGRAAWRGAAVDA